MIAQINNNKKPDADRIKKAKIMKRKIIKARVTASLEGEKWEIYNSIGAWMAGGFNTYPEVEQWCKKNNCELAEVVGLDED